MSVNSLAEARQMIAWCDLKNKEENKKLLHWLELYSEDDRDVYIGIHPDTGALVGPCIQIGEKIRVIYKSPVRLPFDDPEEGAVIFHVAEIVGTILNPFQLSNVECVICNLDDYSIKKNTSSNKSVFRLFAGDRLENVG